MLDRKTILRPITIKFRPWVIVLFVLCPPMWALVGLALWGVPWDSPNAPAWVQAFGSIGAILIAVWVVRSEQRTRELERKRKEAHYMFKAFLTADYIAAALEAVVDTAQKVPPGTAVLLAYFERLKEAAGEIDDFNYSSMADHNFSTAWIAFRRYLRLLTVLLEDQCKGVTHFKPGVAHNTFAKAMEARQKMEASLLEHRDLVGPDVWGAHHP